MRARDRFRIAHRAVRTMLRASRLECTTAGKGVYFTAVFELRHANASEFFAAALRCHTPNRDNAHERP